VAEFEIMISVSLFYATLSIMKFFRRTGEKEEGAGRMSSLGEAR
jgi:hypothetical protein